MFSTSGQLPSASGVPRNPRLKSWRSSLNAIAENYYGMSGLPDSNHLFKQDLKLAVVRHNHPNNEEQTILYDEFIDIMSKDLPLSITDLDAVDYILSGSKSEN